MEEKYYSIGEAASIMGITVQTLRYYSKTNLVKPKYINQETGYRYYTADQFHYIDRIRYLQDLGLSLADITSIMEDGSVDYLLTHLKRQKQATEEELQKVQNHIDDIQWYIDYFTYIDDDHMPEIPYKKTLNTRYLAAVRCYPHDHPDDYHVRLNALRSSNAFRNIKFRRQFAYVLDYNSLVHKELDRQYLGMYLREPPDFDSDAIIKIPAGDYVCFRGRILTQEWNPAMAIALFENREKPTWVLSNEYEDSLVEFRQSMYEIQILYREHG
ncbi:helix-turn-helix domain-containing protein [Eubacteriales bacterium OttesenSCG-928-K08]|nr:helix-turn-helix domain-containing protein [Eubacteriales bacterium OttesenSCG-928-K08]